jgi:hypothetical protein
MNQPKYFHERDVERRRAIKRGLEFVYRTACDPENFEYYGFDYVSCFSSIFATSKDHHLRAMALKMCRERARLWRNTHPTIPPEIDADTVTEFVFAAEAADGIGIPDEAMKSQIRRAAKHFSARDYFWFDPTVEAPPTDVPESCECGADNSRGRTTCRKCRRPLKMLSRYEVWLVALIRSYIGESYRVMLGANYTDVLKWLPSMRPYCGPENDSDFIWSIYAVTHIVYTLNGYGVYNLSPCWLPQEFEFLKKHMHTAIDMDDPETVGEILDSLKSFGLAGRHSLIREGEEFILSRQNPDGSWGLQNADDIYELYHPTVAAIDGLRRNAWRGLGLSLQNVKPFLEQCSAQTRRTLL